MSNFNFDERKVLNRFDSSTLIAKKLLKNEIVKDTEKFVPMQEGYLKNSAVESIASKDDYIIYNEPYAKFLYYGYVMVGKITHSPWARKGETKIKTGKKLNYGKVHPLACAFWFEQSKKLYFNNWLKIVKKVYNKW